LAFEPFIEFQGVYNVLECFLNIILSDTVNGSVVHKESYECIQINCIDMLSSFCKIAELDFILHIINFLLCRIIAHSSHKIG